MFLLREENYIFCLCLSFNIMEKCKYISNSYHNDLDMQLQFLQTHLFVLYYDDIFLSIDSIVALLYMELEKGRITSIQNSYIFYMCLQMVYLLI